MGLDTRAFRKASDAWKREWVKETNEAGEKPVFLGLVMQKLEEPATVEDAPDWHQDDLGILDWPGGLIGGVMSGFGDGPSFRGKAYNDYVEAMTGRSLYEACDDPWHGDTVREVATLLRSAVARFASRDFDPDEIGGRFDPPSPEERESLARWFELCAENDLAVSGDY